MNVRSQAEIARHLLAESQSSALSALRLLLKPGLEADACSHGMALATLQVHRHNLREVARLLSAKARLRSIRN